MKTANFKSMSWLMAFAMIVITSFSACTDEEDNKNQAPVFPEQKDLAINAGETQEFTFEANMEWALTSTAVWCKFVENSEDKVNLKGNAGTQTITIKVTDEEQTTGEASKAQLELSMGGKKQVIAEITRSAKGYELKVYDMEGNEIETLEVGYEAYAQFKVVANYRFAVPETPEFVKLEGDKLMGSTPNQKVTGGLQFVETETYSAKYPFEAGDNAERMLTFKSEDGKASKSIPLYFKGMGAKSINIQVAGTSTRYGWKVAYSGQKFISEGITSDGTLEFDIKTLNDKYTLVYLDEDGEGNIKLMDTDNAWMSCEDDAKGKLVLTVEEYTQTEEQPERKGYILAFPQAKYDEISGDIIGEISNEGIISTEYDAYTIISFTQTQVRENTDGFEIKDANGINIIPVTKVEEETLIEKYGITEIYSITATEGHGYVVNPIFNDWMTYMQEGNTLPITDKEDNPVEIGIEPTMEGDEYALQISNLPEKTDVYIQFPDAEGTTKKVLIIKAPEDGDDGDDGDDEGPQKFVVTDNMTGVSIDVTEYNGNDLETIKSQFDLSTVYKAKGEDLIIEMSPSKLQFDTMKVYELSNLKKNIKQNLMDYGTINQLPTDDYMGSRNDVISIYFGEFSSTPDIICLIIVTCENGETYGIVTSK